MKKLHNWIIKHKNETIFFTIILLIITGGITSIYWSSQSSIQIFHKWKLDEKAQEYYLSKNCVKAGCDDPVIGCMKYCYEREFPNER